MEREVHAPDELAVNLAAVVANVSHKKFQIRRRASFTGTFSQLLPSLSAVYPTLKSRANVDETGREMSTFIARTRHFHATLVSPLYLVVTDKRPFDGFSCTLVSYLDTFAWKFIGENGCHKRNRSDVAPTAMLLKDRVEHVSASLRIFRRLIFKPRPPGN